MGGGKRAVNRRLRGARGRGGAALGPRVEAAVDGAQVTARQVGVDLGGADVGVAEHRLHGAEVGAALDEVGRERVAQLVRRDPLVIPAPLA